MSRNWKSPLEKVQVHSSINITLLLVAFRPVIQVASLKHLGNGGVPLILITFSFWTLVVENRTLRFNEFFELRNYFYFCLLFSYEDWRIGCSARFRAWSFSSGIGRVFPPSFSEHQSEHCTNIIAQPFSFLWYDKIWRQLHFIL